MKKEIGQSREAKILVIEDDPGDLNMIERFLEVSKIQNNVYSVQNGEEALDYLYQRGNYQSPGDAPRPDLILLDLNLPRVDGREVLEDIKQNPELKEIPVVVLTTSEQQTDVWKSYNLGANSYIVKPVNLDQFVKVIQSLQQYWFQVVVLPSGSKNDG